MATVSFTHDHPPPIDAVLEHLATTAINAEKPLRVRVQPDLYDYEAANYKTWSGLVWMIDILDVAEGQRLREGLQDYFKAFGESEKKQTRVLRELKTLAGRG